MTLKRVFLMVLVGLGLLAPEIGGEEYRLYPWPWSLRALSAQSDAFDSVGIFNLTSNYVLLRLDHAESGPERRFHFGKSNPAWSLSIPFSGDFDGDGRDTIGFYNTRLGHFFLANSNLPGRVDREFSWVPAGDAETPEQRALLRPLAGNWGGGTGDRVGLYDGRSSTFYLSENEENVIRLAFGSSGGIPISGDWDGDGIDTPGLYYPGEPGGPHRFRLKDNLGSNLNERVVIFGTVARGYPVAGDWNGDGIDTVGLFDPASKRFELTNSHAQDARVDLELTLRDASLFEFNEMRAIPMIFPLSGRWDTKGDATASAGFEWPVDEPRSQGLDRTALERAHQNAASMEHLHGVLIVRHGRLVSEQYFHGFDATMANNVKSVSKSIISALYGIALDRGYFPGDPQRPLDSFKEIPLSRYLKEFSLTDSVSLYHAFTMSAGFSFTEHPFPAGFIPSASWVSFVVGQEMSPEKPMGIFNYSTGLTHVASEVLQRATGMSTLQFAETVLFEPIGISTTRWDHEPNPGGPFVGGAELYLLPRDMARFGQLYLNAGKVEDGTQVIPAKWVEASTQSLIATNRKELSPDYGAWWWIRSFSPKGSPELSYQSFHALGYGGQHIFVFPSLEMVVVITSRWATDKSGEQIQANFRLLETILDAVDPAR